jgi:tRNA-2-methylthio-N6-dimethylallyladenosine synthase
LKLTKRGYTRKKITDAVNKLKTAGISVSTDLMTGFPGETETDFNETLSLVKECGFSSAYCFKYSPRAGTELAKLSPSPQAVAEKRLKTLLKFVKQQSHKQLLGQIGSTREVLLTTKNEGKTSSNYHVEVNKNYRPGDVIKVKINGSFKYTLTGVAV